MTLIRKEIPVKMEIDLENNTVSVRKDYVIVDDATGEVVARDLHRRAFIPGDLEKVKSYIQKQSGKEIDFLEKMWTPEVIEAYNRKINE